MPIPFPVTRFTLIGHLSSGEIFNTSFWATGTEVGGEQEAQELAAAVGGLFEDDVMPSILGYISNTSGYDALRAYHYTNGDTQADLIGEHTITGGAGTGAANYLPLQASYVVSLRTAFPGRSRRGRMYLPITNYALANHQLTASTAQDLATVFATWFTHVNDLDVGVGTPLVQVVSKFLGDSSPVTHVKVDTRIDVQRRRANQQAITSVKEADVLA